MSQGIMERNLPVAESIGEGDKVRIVTAAGNSKNVDASQICGALKVGVTFTYNEQFQPQTGTLDKTYNEIVNAQSVMFAEEHNDSSEEGFTFYSLFIAVHDTQEGVYEVQITQPRVNNLYHFASDSADGVLNYDLSR